MAIGAVQFECCGAAEVYGNNWRERNDHRGGAGDVEGNLGDE